MAEHSFHSVDAFRQQRYTVDQFALVDDAKGFDGDEMQQTAREPNDSWATFVASPGSIEAGFGARILTSGENGEAVYGTDRRPPTSGATGNGARAADVALSVDGSANAVARGVPV